MAKSGLLNRIDKKQPKYVEINEGLHVKLESKVALQIKSDGDFFSIISTLTFNEAATLRNTISRWMNNNRKFQSEIDSEK